jgi:integrase
VQAANLGAPRSTAQVAARRLSSRARTSGAYRASSRKRLAERLRLHVGCRHAASEDNFLKRVFKPLLRQAELPAVTFHSLHTANSLLIEVGEDPLAIAGSLGHSDTRMMFERYGHLFDHTAKRVAQTADRIFVALEPNCRTIVENATLSLSIAAAVEKANRPYRIRRLH